MQVLFNPRARTIWSSAERAAATGVLDVSRFCMPSSNTSKTLSVPYTYKHAHTQKQTCFVRINNEINNEIMFLHAVMHMRHEIGWLRKHSMLTLRNANKEMN